MNTEQTITYINSAEHTSKEARKPHYHVRGKDPKTPYYIDSIWPTRKESCLDLTAKRQSGWTRTTWGVCQEDCCPFY